MANTTARFDPSIVVDTQFRVARNGAIIFEFYDSDGNPEDMYESEWEFILKKQANSPTNVLRLTTGAGNILVQGNNDEKVVINITYAESNIPSFNYYYEIYRPDLKKTWFTGTCFVSNGQYNASVNQEFVSTTTDEQVVRIELSSSGSPVQVTLGSSSTVDLSAYLTSAAAASTYLAKSNNLSDLANAATARTNLGLGTLATQSGTFTDKQNLVNSATALVDGATIDLTAIKHTLSCSVGRTFTISYTGDDITLIITYSATSGTFTFPATTLCVADGTASGNNTMAFTGVVSGDKLVIAIKKVGSDYYAVGKNFGQ